jgi:hypothetical protein
VHDRGNDLVGKALVNVETFGFHCGSHLCAGRQGEERW